MTADSSTDHITTHSGEDGGSGVSLTGQRLTIPYLQVLCGVNEPDLVGSPEIAEQNSICSDPVTVVEAPDSADTQPDISNCSDSCNAGGVKKSAWNKPSANGDPEGSTTTPVMGAASWPALSESTRPGVRSLTPSSESSSTPPTDQSLVVSQAPVASQPRPNQAKPNTNTHLNTNHVHQVRQRPFRRGGASASFNVRQPSSSPPPFPYHDVFKNLVSSASNSPNRNPARRNNFGLRPNGYGGRRGPRTHMQQHPIATPLPLHRGYIPSPHPVPPPFIPRPYGTPMPYDMGASYVYLPTLPPETYTYRGPPPVPVSSIFIPVMDPPLCGLILNQIEYYFSEENLVKDNFLRSNMNEQGWVPINLIAGFRRVQSLTNDIQMIKNSLRDSISVEIQGDKVRSKDWRRWIHIPNRFQVNKASENLIEEALMEKMTMEDGSGHKDSSKVAIAISGPCS